MLRTDEKKWYRQFWPWFLITLPTIVIIACFYTMYLAMHSPLSMVKKDYYQEGLTINKNLAELEKARKLGLIATIQLQDNRVIKLELLSSKLLDTYADLTVQFNHPVDDSKDLTFTLHAQPDKSFSTEPMTPAQWQLLTTEKHWYVQLQPLLADWVLQGKTEQSHINTITLDPDSG